ncbi:4'-phosphopantetheinyl transferase family protein [Aeromonas hydrophila]|uniref:4'-phosphopantetheinyl transferase family protein n=1 Tax=Aeromonas hydrophila TaxID=644 RepID=UPI00191EA0B7|nr:4'-phosphopantetheinyl transferase superfamily protein [Aeromonas hydrophila]MBL0560501.1 4'-phosphopantetheinyl transferase superfamily protein [Aeromonas hydrophila]
MIQWHKLFIQEKAFIKSVYINRLAPTEHVQWVFCEFDTKQFHESLFLDNHIPLKKDIINSVVQRKGEYLAGRIASRLAQYLLGLSPEPVGTGQHRNPMWPTNTIGSITHANGYAMVAMARTQYVHRIGIDYEPWIDASTIKSVIDIIMCDREKTKVENDSRSPRKDITIIFSAKESLFKALYDECGEYKDFHAAETVNIDHQSSRVRLRLTESWSNKLRAGTIFDLEYITHHEGVITYLINTKKP